MAAEKTIAVMGSYGKALPFIKAFSGIKCNLILIGNGYTRERLTGMLPRNRTANIELLRCNKDACWEADILIIDPDKADECSILKEVADVLTQKYIISFSSPGDKNLEALLPHSKVVYALEEISTKAGIQSSSWKLHGNDANAKMSIADIMNDSGLKTQIN